MSVAKPTQSERMDRLESLILALAESNTQIEGAAKPKSSKPKATKAEAPSWMSCWTVAKVNPQADGSFEHKNDAGKSRSYRALSEADAIANVKANYRAGKTFAIAL